MTRPTTTMSMALAALVALVLGAVAVSNAANERGITGEQAALAGAAAREATRGGEVVSIERGDDGGATWSVEVLSTGQEIEVSLDENYVPLHLETEPYGDDDGQHDDLDGDDRPVTEWERERATEAALRATGGGRVVDLDRSDDPGEAYEIEVVDGQTETDVALDGDFKPVPNQPYDD